MVSGPIGVAARPAVTAAGTRVSLAAAAPAWFHWEPAAAVSFPNGFSPVSSVLSGFFLSLRRVLSPVVVVFFFFLPGVSFPPRPSALTAPRRSATSAASAGAGASGSSCGPFDLGASAAWRDRCIASFSLASFDAREGCPAHWRLPQPGLAAPASSVWLEGACGKVSCGALPKRIFSFFPGFIEA